MQYIRSLYSPMFALFDSIFDLKSDSTSDFFIYPFSFASNTRRPKLNPFSYIPLQSSFGDVYSLMSIDVYFFDVFP